MSLDVPKYPRGFLVAADPIVSAVRALEAALLAGLVPRFDLDMESAHGALRHTKRILRGLERGGLKALDREGWISYIEEFVGILTRWTAGPHGATKTEAASAAMSGLDEARAGLEAALLNLRGPAAVPGDPGHHGWGASS